MRHLIESFQKNRGLRGVTFYNEHQCSFLPWNRVLEFLDAFPVSSPNDPFADKLTEKLANYDPDREFVAVRQTRDSVSVELYTLEQ